MHPLIVDAARLRLRRRRLHCRQPLLDGLFDAGRSAVASRTEVRVGEHDLRKGSHLEVASLHVDEQLPEGRQLLLVAQSTHGSTCLF